MNKFCELHYERPDYQQARKNLIKYKNKISSAPSYDEVRQLWLSMKESMQYVGYLEQYAYTCYLRGISYDFYKEEVRIQDIEDPQLAMLENECDKTFLASPYVYQFAQEFGDQIVNQLRNNVMLSDEQSTSLQAEEYRLRTEYTTLRSTGQKGDELSDKYYQILDNLIRVRTEIAKTLGFKDYIEMAYRLHGRFDYGAEELSAFRNQIQQLITPACAEMRKVETVKYPNTVMTSTTELISAIKNMFCDISKGKRGLYKSHPFARTA